MLCLSMTKQKIDLNSLKNLEKNANSLPIQKQGVVKSMGFKIFKSTAKRMLKRAIKKSKQHPDSEGFKKSKENLEDFIDALNKKDEDRIEKWLIYFGWLKR